MDSDGLAGRDYRARVHLGMRRSDCGATSRRGLRRRALSNTTWHISQHWINNPFYGLFGADGPLRTNLRRFSIPHPALGRWQLLFIIEDALTCGLVMVAWFLVPGGPHTTWFLTKDERNFAAEKVQNGLPARGEVAAATIRNVVEIAKDWKLRFTLIFNICTSFFPASAFSVFLSLVVQGKTIEANLMSVPPAVCGTAGRYLFALSSDRREERGYHITLGIVIALAGLIAVVRSPASAAKSGYAALCVLLLGSYVPPPLTVAWLSGNAPAQSKRALVEGINGWSNSGRHHGGAALQARACTRVQRGVFATLVGVLAIPGRTADGKPP
ncbi:hypothetical protein MFIFM68171_05541 [Madurella fahalii]|uniref:Uncharacterized protein n=1 Tax=Madurella fahalii TaxID=1157608 RepID=A0ABQ0GC36_9PEZI